MLKLAVFSSTRRDGQIGVLDEMILRYYSSSAQRSTEKSLGNRGDGGGLTRASLAAVVGVEFRTIVAVKFGVRSISIAV